MKTRSILATYFTLLIAIAGCGGPAETTGTHTLTIVETSGGPFGGTSGGSTDADGNKIDTFESGNGKYKIKLEGDVVTINGDRYTLDKPESSILLEDDRAEINGVVTAPDKE